jgi:hypothetical protein
LCVSAPDRRAGSPEGGSPRFLDTVNAGATLRARARAPWDVATPAGTDGGRARRAHVLISTHGTAENARSGRARSFAQIPVADCSLRTIRSLVAELESVVAEAELAVGCVRVTMRQDTSGLYAVAVGRADIDAGSVRHAHVLRLLVGASSAGDEHEAHPRNHRQRLPHRTSFQGERCGSTRRLRADGLFGSAAISAGMLDGRWLNAHTRTLGRPPHGLLRTGRMPSKLCAGARMSRRRDQPTDRKQSTRAGLGQFAKRGAPSHRRAKST